MHPNISSFRSWLLDGRRARATATVAALCLGLVCFAGAGAAQQAVERGQPHSIVGHEVGGFAYRGRAIPIWKSTTLGRFRNVAAFREALDSWHCATEDPADEQRTRVALTTPKIEVAARLLEKHPRLNGLSQQAREEAVEFAVGNIFFSLFHELGHALVTEMGLPVLGREEDAADSYASVTMLQMGTICSERVLIQSAWGWFLSDQRDREQGVKLPFYGEHALNQQRAYNIICLMVGSDPDKFTDLADKSEMPEDRQQTCAGDYSNASWSWTKALERHRRAPEQPRQRIEVSYLEGTGDLDVHAQILRSARILEIVAEHAADRYVWRAPLTIELKSCGESNAHWNVATYKLTLCYEMAEEYIRLYRDQADGFKVAQN